ncbi:MAG: ABC transporter ATP-binding protein, partial [Planctomycetota bacterium]|nr:ABC transporter ATP-binding protein [Planctomycetota bacterium]
MAEDHPQHELAIRVGSLHKSYRLGDRRVDALNGMDLEITEPGFYAVMGASGSGKSTLLHLLAGLDKADRGTLEVLGIRVDELPEHELTRYRRHTVGVMFQRFNLLPTLTAYENVVLPGVLDKRPPAELRERGMGLLEEMGLADRSRHRPDALSGGEQQRVAIARALFFAPQILFADEPTGNLDTLSSERLWSTMEDLADKRNMIVLMVTHEAEAASRCRKVFLVKDGCSAGVIDA